VGGQDFFATSVWFALRALRLQALTAQEQTLTAEFPKKSRKDRKEGHSRMQSSFLNHPVVDSQLQVLL